MAQSDSRTQIIVACISLAGVLAAAVIANWSRINGSDSANKAQPEKIVIESERPPETAERQRGELPRRAAPQLQQPAQAVVGENENGPDSVVVVTAVPPLGSVLKYGQLTDFNVTIRYRLTTVLPNASLQVQLHQYDGAPDCTGPNHIPEAEHVPMLQGDHIVKVALPYVVGTGKGNVPKGSIRFGATIWSDLATRQLFKTFPLPRYCYAFY